MITIKSTDCVLAKLLPPAKPLPDKKYIPSQFALPFEHKGRQYIFNILTKQFIEGRMPESAKAGQGYDDLIYSHFLVPEDKDECAHYNAVSRLMRTFNRKKGVQSYIILPTTGCNARCVYCFEENFKQVTMTPAIAEQTIRYIAETHDKDEIGIEWFGGEPLLCPDIIDRISCGLKDAEIPFKSTMISNGSVITPKIIKKMVDNWNLRDIQISMDGIEDDYIKRKQYRSYNNFYQKILESVDSLSEAGISVTIRCNVDENNWSGVPQFLNDLKSFVKHKEKVGVFFAPLYEVRAGENDVEMWKKILSLRPIIKNAGFIPTTFMGLNMNFRIYNCMADSNSVVINSDGSLHSCNQFPNGSQFGDIWNGITDKNAKEEFSRVDKIREKCRNCPFLPECTGFSHCPITDTHCKEIREVIALDTLRRILDKKETSEINKTSIYAEEKENETETRFHNARH